MRKLAFLSIAFALVALSFYGCDETTAPTVQVEEATAAPSFDLAHSQNPSAAVVIKDSGCNLFDGDGHMVFASSAHKVITKSGRSTLKCSVKGVSNSTGKAVHYDTDVNPSGPGTMCRVSGALTRDWKETVSASGNATLTCTI